MSKAKSFFLFFAVFILPNFALLAQHGEAPSAADAGLHEKEFSGQQTEKWVEVQKSLLDLKIKVDGQKTLVADLLKSKKDNEGKISQDEIEILKKEHEKLQSLTKDYNQLLADFQFRFPEKGLETGRKYIRLENQSLEEMENTPTFQGRLKKLNKKIKKQFQAEEKNISSSGQMDSHEKKPVSKELKKNIEPDVTEQIILVK